MYSAARSVSTSFTSVRIACANWSTRILLYSPPRLVCSSPFHGNDTDRLLLIVIVSGAMVWPDGFGPVDAGVIFPAVFTGTTGQAIVWSFAACSPLASIVTAGMNPVSSRSTLSSAT